MGDGNGSVTTPSEGETLEFAVGVDRRKALQLASMTLAGVPILVACGNAKSAATKGHNSVSPDGPIAKTTDVPEGSAKIFAEHKIVITNDPPGNFQGFSYLCTHMGCPVTGVEAELIQCTCHGSEFSTRDGSVARGPATKPLTQVDLRIEGVEIFRA